MMKDDSSRAPLGSTLKRKVQPLAASILLVSVLTTQAGLLNDPVGFASVKPSGPITRDLVFPLPSNAVEGRTIPLLPPGEKFVVEHPIDPSVSFNISFGAADVHLDTIENRTQAIRDAAREPEEVPNYSKDKGGKEVKEVKEIACPKPHFRVGVWTSGSGQFQTINGSNGAAGFHTNAGSVSAGIDYLLTDHFAVGITGGYTGSVAGLTRGGHLSADTGRGGIYGTYFNGPVWIEGSVLGGGTDYDARYGTRNNIIYGGRFSGTEIESNLRAGYDIKFRGITVTPTAELRQESLNIDHYQVKSDHAGTIDLSDSNADSLKTRFGVRAATQFHIGCVTLRPSVEVDWQREYFSQNRTIAGVFNSPGIGFVDKTPHHGRDSIIVNSGISAQVTPRISVFAYYIGDLAGDGWSSHTVTGGLSYSF